VRAGTLSAKLRGADLTDVRWGGLEVAAAIQVTVRDDRWGTLRPVLRRADERGWADGFSIDLDVVHGDDAFAWHGSIRGSSDGTLEFTMDGVAERDVIYRRIGICVLHPWATYVGARFEASGAGGHTSGAFPRRIVPQRLVDGEYEPMVPAFRRLEVAFGRDRRAVFMFEGEDHGFELEDQRNWSDASFKTYPTPLARSAPRTLARGERLAQRLRLRIEGVATPFVPQDGPIEVWIGGTDGRRMPPIGLTAPPPGEANAERLVELGPAHLRVTTSPGDDPRALDAAISLANRTGIPLEVGVMLHDDPEAPELGTVGARLRATHLARVLVLRASGVTADGRFVSSVRSRLGIDAPLAGGTASHFSELNRSIPEPSGMDAVALALSPQVHAVDERSMVETLEVQTQIVDAVRELTNGWGVVVSPVTLASHDPAVPDDDIDERAHSAFGAAWTAGSVCALAVGGVTSVTLHERADRTVLASRELARAFRLLAMRAGLNLHAVSSSDPRRVRVVAASGRPPLLVNLTTEPQEVRIDGAVSGALPLAPYEVAEFDRSPR
jgi:D-apionolactonase